MEYRRMFQLLQIKKIFPRATSNSHTLYVNITAIYTGQWQLQQLLIIGFVIRWVPLVEQELPTDQEHLRSPPILSGGRVTWSLVFCIVFCRLLFVPLSFLCPRDKESGGILVCPVRPCVRSSVRPSGYIYMVCQAIYSYSFGATALIFCRMFMHIMEMFMSTGFWFSSNILKMTGSWT
jgi:hypothetical protein